MVNVADYFRADPEAFDRGYQRVNALQADRARMQAGNALTQGNYQGAASALFNAGDVDAGARVAYYGQRRDNDAAEQKRAQEKASWEAIGEVAGRLMNVYRSNPQAVGPAFDQLSQRLIQVGETPEEIAQTRAQLLADPENTLMALGAAVEQKVKTFGDSRGGVYAVDEAALGRNFSDQNAIRTLREPHVDPLDEELKRAKIEATKAQERQRDASAAKSRRTGGGKGGGGSKLPPGFILD